MDATEGAQTDIYKKSRFLYIIEATLEYFVSILVGGAYLARLTNAVGISDATTGVLSAFVSLGCSAQMLAIFLARAKRVKPFVTAGHFISQALFALLYFTPFVPVSTSFRAVLLGVLLLLAHFIHNVIFSPKIAWYMGLVEDKKRGVFTANKEIVSLLTGTVFTFALGKMIDHFEARGEVSIVFILSGVALFGLCLLHTLTLLFSKEKPSFQDEKDTKGGFFADFAVLLKDKAVRSVTLVAVLWSVINYTSAPFLGSYQNKELGFSAVYIAVIAAVYSVARSILSRPMGRLADKRSFASMLTLCFLLYASACVIGIFTVPKNGKVFYMIYQVLYAAALAGINSGSINLIYDYVPEGQRTAALALKNSVAGVAGFLTTALVSRAVVARVQANGNTVFGIPVYAQQVTFLLALLLTVFTLVYLQTVVKRLPRSRCGDTPRALPQSEGGRGE